MMIRMTELFVLIHTIDMFASASTFKVELDEVSRIAMIVKYAYRLAVLENSARSRSEFIGDP
jgi:hypothetical protein